MPAGLTAVGSEHTPHLFVGELLVRLSIQADVAHSVSHPSSAFL